MLNYWEPTALLLVRDEDTLTDDERSSLKYFEAFIDEFDGIGGRSAEVVWCRTARLIHAAAHLAGRIPTAAEGMSERQLAWIEEQKNADLNSFQHARLAVIPGW